MAPQTLLVVLTLAASTPLSAVTYCFETTPTQFAGNVPGSWHQGPVTGTFSLTNYAITGQIGYMGYSYESQNSSLSLRVGTDLYSWTGTLKGCVDFEEQDLTLGFCLPNFNLVLHIWSSYWANTIPGSPGYDPNPPGTSSIGFGSLFDLDRAAYRWDLRASSGPGMGPWSAISWSESPSRISRIPDTASTGVLMALGLSGLALLRRRTTVRA